MGNATQVAFQLDVGALAAVDEIAQRTAVSRAEILRSAVREYLSRQREAAIDDALELGYQRIPPGDIERSWAQRSIEGLAMNNLDW